MDDRTRHVLLADPRIAAVPVTDCGERLVDLRTVAALVVDDRQADPAGAYAHVRAGIRTRLLGAQRTLPDGWRLVLVEGYRPPTLQHRYFHEYRDELARRHPGWAATELTLEASRYIAPPDVAPHITGGAVDVTLAEPGGTSAWMGTEINATPAESGGATCTDAPNLSAAAVRNRALLGQALRAAGFVNYPTEWWHWSYGDRYWAFRTGAVRACYAPVEVPVAIGTDIS